MGVTDEPGIKKHDLYMNHLKAEKVGRAFRNDGNNDGSCTFLGSVLGT